MALENTQKNPDKFLKIAINDLGINPEMANNLLRHTAPKWLANFSG